MILKDKKKLVLLLILVLSLSLLSGCGNNSDATLSQKNNIKLDNMIIEKVGEMRIFFGHQSVGGNILDGINALHDKGSNDKISITSTREAEQINSPGLYHAWIGENGSTQKKINDFKQLIESGIGNKIDVALMKFCFIDFNQNTNVNKVFESYKSAMKDLQYKYPNVTFIHVTTPLISNNMTFKDWLKKILGRSQKNDADNIARNKYNNLLRNYYQGKEPLFDLAEFESTDPEGKKHLFTVNGKQYEAMVPTYTGDGGHLNTYGSRLIASTFLSFLEKTKGK